MKLYAQHGAQEGDKIAEGFNRQLLDGVIYSPRDVGLGSLKEKLASLGREHPTAERLVDPQAYAAFLGAKEQARLGFLAKDYTGYFETRRRPQLERESQIKQDLQRALAFQADLAVTGLIAPNILIPNSLNSIEAVIAKNFIRDTAAEHAKLADRRPVYATLAISRNALGDKQELLEFLNEITLLEERPRGFYVLIAARSADARSDIFNADVIAAWMLINHTLNLNGFEVVNGYSDLLTPFLGASGGAAGALGWWSNLRMFSLDRFGPAEGGGRLPVQRYLSEALLNRIAFFELDQVRKLLPAVLNKLPTDALYSVAAGSEPPRNSEVFQAWEAIRALNRKMLSSDQSQSLKNCRQAVAKAGLAYDEIESQGLRLDQKSNSDHLPSLSEGLQLFSRLAELEELTQKI
jgi:hypothetical protein